MKMCLFLFFSFVGILSGEPDDTKGVQVLAEEAYSDSHQSYIKGKKELRAKFRADFAKAVELAESGEIYLLSFTMESELPDDGILLGFVNEDYVSRDHLMKDRPEEDFEKEPTHFFIEPYEKFSKILGKKTLNKKQLKQCKDATAKLLRSPKDVSGAFCHYPIHGIRLVAGGVPIFQTSICYYCRNYYLHYPDSGMNSRLTRFLKEWVGFDGEELEVFLKKEMPIPQWEIDRFEAEMKK